MGIGYDRDLFILPFDHRGTFRKKMPGIQDDEIRSLKWLVFEAFERATEMGFPQERGAILVDEQYGDEILRDAKAQGILTAVTAEKSGQDEFDFEYGSEFAEHFKAVDTPFVKALVRYNPEGESWVNLRQREKLKLLVQACREQGRKLLLELIVPPTRDQLDRVDNRPSRFDAELRPALVVLGIRELQAEGIEPDVWKLEGIEAEEDMRKIAAQARVDGRDSVGVVVLGRGEDLSKVRHWLSVAAPVPGLIGFAVGRTLFWDTLIAFRETKLSRMEAAEQIARNFLDLFLLWEDARHPQPPVLRPRPDQNAHL